MSRVERELPSRPFLMDRLQYRVGNLFWKPRPLNDFKTARAAKIWNSKYPGQRAGSPMGNGYRLVAMLDTKFLEHRLIYQMIVGTLLPRQRVDHIDRDHTNNRYENLRACSHAENAMNQPGRRAGALPKHVYWSRHEQKYKVQIRAGGQRHFVGTFAYLNDAADAAQAARERLHGKFADHRGMSK